MSGRSTPDNGMVNTLADRDDVQEEVSEAGCHPLGWPRIKMVTHYASWSIQERHQGPMTPKEELGGGGGATSDVLQHFLF